MARAPDPEELSISAVLVAHDPRGKTYQLALSFGGFQFDHISLDITRRPIVLAQTLSTTQIPRQ